MAVRVVQLGSRRQPGEGLRVGTVRRVPRGVPKGQWGKRDFFDLWLPELAPSAGLVKFAYAEPWTERRWTTYARRYLAEMRRPAARRLLALLAALSHGADFSVGCYCENPRRCHRSLLRDLLVEHGAAVPRGGDFA